MEGVEPFVSPNELASSNTVSPGELVLVPEALRVEVYDLDGRSRWNRTITYAGMGRDGAQHRLRCAAHALRALQLTARGARG